MKKLLVALLVAIAALAAVVASRPAEFRIARSLTISAPPELVFASLDDFQRWGPWSPWEGLDPSMQRDYAGPQSGVGATYHWLSTNDEVGEGRMTITASQPGERLAIQLEFIAPFAATNEAVFALVATADGSTSVTWSMTGHNGFMAKAAGLFMDMDAAVGGDFEKGLAALRRLSEEQATVRAADEAKRVQEEAMAAEAASAETERSE